MADKSDMLVFRVLLDKKYDFMVAFAKSGTIGELRQEISSVAHELYPEFRASQVSSIHDDKGTRLPDRYQVQMFLENNSEIICYSSGGKEKDNVKKLRRKDKAEHTKTNKQTSAKHAKQDEQWNTRGKQAKTFLKNFVADMQELENESGNDEKLIGECSKSVKKMLKKTQSRASGAEDDLCESVDQNERLQGEQNSKTERNKPPAKHCLREAKGTVNHVHRSSSEEILSASKYKSLFANPAHCRPKRKEAIESSASKVAEWLSANDVSSNVQDASSDDGTMDVLSEDDRPLAERVMFKKAQGVESDDSEEQDMNEENCDGDDDQGASSRVVNKVEKVNNSKQAIANEKSHCKQMNVTDVGVSASTSKSLCPASANLLKCQVKIEKLPYCTKCGRNRNVNCSSVKKHLGSEDRIDIGTASQAQTQKTKDVQTSAKGSSDEQDKRGVVSDENEENKKSVPNRHPRQCHNKQSTTKNDNDDDYDGDDDDAGEEDNEVFIDVVSVDCTARKNLEAEVDRGKRVEKSSTSNVDLDKETFKYQGQNTNKHSVKEVRANEGTEDDTDGENNDLSPVYLTPIKDGKQITWLKERNPEEDSEHMEDNYEDLMNGINMSNGKTTERPRRDKSPLLSSETAKESEGEDVKLRKSARRKSVKTKRRFEQKRGKQKGNEDVLVENVDQVSVSDRTVNLMETVEGNEELEILTQDPAEKRSKRKERELTGNKDTLVENDNRGNVKNGTTTPKKTTEEKAQIGHDSQDSSEKRSKRKERELTGNKDTLVESDNQGNVKNGASTQKETEENRELERDSQDSSEKRSERKKWSAFTAVENVHDENVKKGATTPKKTSQDNVQLELGSKDSSENSSEQIKRGPESSEEDPDRIRCEQKRRTVALLKKVNQENDSGSTAKSKEGNAELQFASQERTEKKSEDEKRMMGVDGNSMVENVTQEPMNNKTIVTRKSEETPKKIAKKDGYSEDELDGDEEKSNEKRILCDQVVIENTVNDPLREVSQVNQSKMSKKKEKRRKRRSSISESTQATSATSPGVEKVDSSVDSGFCENSRIEAKQNEHVERESDKQDTVDRKSRKAMKRKSDDSLLQKTERETHIGEKTSKKEVRMCEDERNKDDQKSNEDRNTKNEQEIVNDVSDQVEKQKKGKKKDKKSKSKSRKRESEQFDSCNNKHVELESVALDTDLNRTKHKPSTDEKTNKRKESIHSYFEEKQSEDEEKLNDRKRSNERDAVNDLSVDKDETPKKSKKKNKRSKTEFSSMDDTTNTATTSNTAERVALKRKADEEFNFVSLQNSESVPPIGEKKSKKKASKDNYEDGRSKGIEKSSSISDQLQDGNHVNESKKSKKKKEKKYMSESSTTGSTACLTSTPQTVDRIALKRKADEQSSCDLLQNEASIDVKTKKKASKNRYEDERSKDKKVNDKESSNQVEGVSDTSIRIKRKKEKRRKSELSTTEDTSKTTLTSPTIERTALKRKSDKILNCDLTQTSENEQPCGEKTSKKKASRKSHEDERSEGNEKLNNRKTNGDLERASDSSKKSKTKKEKSRTIEFSNIESTFAPSTLETLNSSDSGYSEKQNEKRFVLTDPVRSKTKGDKTKFKASRSLLDLALDDTADKEGSKTSRKEISSEGRPAHQLARHFRQTPKGFLHSATSRKTASSTSSVIIRRKSRTDTKHLPIHAQMTAEEKDLVASRLNLEQLFDDESLWDT